MAIVGPNGSGKTTLLKVVAGVIRPQEGTVRVVGNVTPLTQLGAGFNGELTGRENIYLNGAVFGLSRKQMDRRFADIVAFAELADFVDSPLRTYSTGMIARLGFATAIHTDPEILLLDEVLAVGDSSFQHKCLNQIEQFKRKGVTILFVSHDMSQVRAVCDQVLWLDRGRAVAWGDSESVVSQYENHFASGGVE
jgi:ABC-type polysaccharide/polyol phosphate transport system ATPase subunit